MTQWLPNQVVPTEKFYRLLEEALEAVEDEIAEQDHEVDLSAAGDGSDVIAVSGVSHNPTKD